MLKMIDQMKDLKAPEKLINSRILQPPRKGMNSQHVIDRSARDRQIGCGQNCSTVSRIQN